MTVHKPRPALPARAHSVLVYTWLYLYCVKYGEVILIVVCLAHRRSRATRNRAIRNRATRNRATNAERGYAPIQLGCACCFNGGVYCNYWWYWDGVKSERVCRAHVHQRAPLRNPFSMPTTTSGPSVVESDWRTVRTMAIQLTYKIKLSRVQTTEIQKFLKFCQRTDEREMS